MRVDATPLHSGSDDDADSLFGSPPPSPARGRSPQLALPTGPSSAENVGTIALPGSQINSELPPNPAALLLSAPSSSPTPPPPSPSARRFASSRPSSSSCISSTSSS